MLLFASLAYTCTFSCGEWLSNIYGQIEVAALSTSDVKQVQFKRAI